MLPRIGIVGGPGGYPLGSLPMRKAQMTKRATPARMRKVESRNSMDGTGSFRLMIHLGEWKSCRFPRILHTSHSGFFLKAEQ